MSIIKGYARISIKKSVEARLKNIKIIMEQRSPDKYDRNIISYNSVIDWMIDEVLKT